MHRPSACPHRSADVHFAMRQFYLRAQSDAGMAGASVWSQLHRRLLTPDALEAEMDVFAPTMGEELLRASIAVRRCEMQHFQDMSLDDELRALLPLF